MRTVPARRSMFVTLAAAVALTGSLVAASPVTAAASGFRANIVSSSAGVPVQV